MWERFNLWALSYDLIEVKYPPAEDIEGIRYIVVYNVKTNQWEAYML